MSLALCTRILSALARLCQDFYFISTHQVAAATAPLQLQLMLLRAWFMVIRQVAQA